MDINVVLKKIAINSRCIPYVNIRMDPILAIINKHNSPTHGEKITGKITGCLTVSSTDL